ncbi:hypothetical protein J6S35_00585 [Candidatus Saccharibacteria bacterium]|nr:hypothetical protein [Candidatus Saccharibacteria bacterium]
MGKSSNELWPQNGDVYYWVRSDIGDICESEWVDGLKRKRLFCAFGVQ